MTSGGHTCSIFRSLHLIIGNALIHEMHSAVINSPQHTGHQQGNDEQRGIIKCGVKVLSFFWCHCYISVWVSTWCTAVSVWVHQDPDTISLSPAASWRSVLCLFPLLPHITVQSSAPQSALNVMVTTQTWAPEIVPTLMGRPQVDTHGCVSLCVSKKLRFVVVLSSPYLQGMEVFSSDSDNKASHPRLPAELSEPVIWWGFLSWYTEKRGKEGKTLNLNLSSHILHSWFLFSISVIEITLHC